MSKIEYRDLSTNIKDAIYIEGLQITQKFNEHGTIKLLVLLKESANHKDILEKTKVIQVHSNGAVSGFLFQGIVTKSEVRHSGKVYQLYVEGISFSYLLDIQRRYASYQDTGATYLDVMKLHLKDYDNAFLLDKLTEGKTTDQLLLQYNETDWEFIRRLASHFYSGVIVDVTQNSPKLILGAYGTNSVGELEQFSYVMEKDIESYLKVSKNGKSGIKESDFTYYKIETEENYAIGDIVTYQNKSLYLKEKETTLSRGRVIHIYRLATKEGFLVEKKWNMELIGLSLKGKVLSVNSDKVKVHMEIDKSQEEGKAYEFLYTTMYAAEGHAGWYCMPEVGDMVQIYFPEKEESLAVAMQSVRQSDGAVSGIGTDVKLLRTAAGKEIKLSPDGITITCCDGKNEKTGEKNQIFITLKDDGGITLTSTKSVNITADEDLNLVSKKKIVLSAKEEVSLNCKTSKILLDKSKVDIAGKEVKFN